MAVGDGIYDNVLKLTESHGHGIPDTYQLQSREVYWARYVDCKSYLPELLDAQANCQKGASPLLFFYSTLPSLPA